MWFLADGWIPIFLYRRGFPVAMCMSSDLSRPSKQRKAAKGCHLPGVGPSGVVLLVPPFAYHLCWLPRLKETRFVWRQTQPFFLRGCYCLLSLKIFCIFWVCLPSLSSSLFCPISGLAFRFSWLWECWTYMQWYITCFKVEKDIKLFCIGNAFK